MPDEIVRHVGLVGRRRPEPEEVMLGQSAFAYRSAPYLPTHLDLASGLEREFGENLFGTLVDLGSGPGDISLMMAMRHPRIHVLGIDASEDMLSLASSLALSVGNGSTGSRVRFAKGKMPFDPPPQQRADIVTSINVLHHLPRPEILWNSIKQFAKIGAPIFVADLRRCFNCLTEAKDYVEEVCPEADAIAKLDFARSLRAAYTCDQVRNQLIDAGLSYLEVQPYGERHLSVSGVFIGEVRGGRPLEQESIPISRNAFSRHPAERLDPDDFPAGWPRWTTTRVGQDG